MCVFVLYSSLHKTDSKAENDSKKQELGTEVVYAAVMHHLRILCAQLPCIFGMNTCIKWTPIVNYTDYQRETCRHRAFRDKLHDFIAIGRLQTVCSFTSSVLQFSSVQSSSALALTRVINSLFLALSGRGHIPVACSFFLFLSSSSQFTLNFTRRRNCRLLPLTTFSSQTSNPPCLGLSMWYR